jgi:O-antigen ligase
MLKNVSYYLILLFLVCLPLDHFYSEVVLVALTAHTALLAKREDWNRFLDARVLLLQALYGVVLVATLYSPYKQLAVQDVFQELPLFLFPWICAVLQPVLRKRKDDLLCAFCIACVAVLVYLYTDAARILYYYHLPLSELFSDHFVNQRFTEPLGIHATYLSMYCALSLFWCVRKGLGATTAGKQVLLVSCALVLTLGLVQLSAKSVWMALIGMITVGVPFFLFSGRRRVIAFVVSGVAVVVLAVILLQGAFFHKRMVEDFSRDMTPDRAANVENQSRMVRWGVAWSLIRSAPLAGYGAGSERPLLKDAYFRDGLYEPFLLGLNAHNQFLHWWLTTGLLGLGVYTGFLGWGLYRATRVRDLVWTAFMVMVIITSFAENILDVQQGLFFVSFFFSFFYFSKRPRIYGQ